MQRCVRRAFAAAALCVSVQLAAAAAFHLKDGDTVVFYGDSITDQRLYTTFTETFVVTRMPKLNVRFVHSGWGGDRVTGGGGGPVDLRLKRDVLPYRPAVVTIMLGMNDGRYRAFDESIFKTYADGYREIVRMLKGAVPGVRITAIEPSPYDDVTRPPMFDGGYNAVLIRYGEFVRQLASAEGLTVADLNTPVVQAVQKAKSLDAEGAARLIPDRVHPGPGGHLLMAAALLKAWGAPGVVSSVAIDAAQGAAAAVENSEVSNVAKTGDGLTWVQRDGALPMPIDPKDAGLALALRASDFTESLNRQPLRVTGLAAGSYKLKIDGDVVATLSAQELAGGVNLATLPTPMAKQAADVHALTLKHNAIHFARWRSVQVPLQNDGVTTAAGALASLDTLDDELVAQQRLTAQPKARRFELIREQ